VKSLEDKNLNLALSQGKQNGVDPPSCSLVAGGDPPSVLPPMFGMSSLVDSTHSAMIRFLKQK